MVKYTSGKHRIFDTIQQNLLKSCTNKTNLLETVPNDLSVILCKYIMLRLQRLVSEMLEIFVQLCANSVEFCQKFCVLQMITFPRIFQLRRVGTFLNHIFGFWKNSMKNSMISTTCHFWWSVAPLILKLTKNYAQTIWKSFWEEGIVYTTFEQTLWNSVKNSMFCRSAEINFQTSACYYRGKFEPYGTVRNKFQDLQKIPRNSI